MAICGDMEKVFEVGSVFRAEKSFTYRHLVEFVGLDFEMQIYEDYHEVIQLLGELFEFIFNGLSSKYGKELDLVKEQFPFEPLKFKNLVLTFPEGIKLLEEAGEEVEPFSDLPTATERRLGELVKEKYDTDFFILEKYPLAARPFYTMPCGEDDRYSNSYDIFIRGAEVGSGAQRIHDINLLLNQSKKHNIDEESISGYLNAFKYGAPPHGGVGLGLERIVMQYLGLSNVRKTSMFPRDPQRLTP